MSLENLLKELRVEYLHSLPQKCKEIEGQISTSDSAALRVAFHNLKGTGKTYGLPEITKVAALIEGALLERPQQGVEAAPLGVELFKKIHAAHTQSTAFDLETSPEFDALQKLLRRPAT